MWSTGLTIRERFKRSLSWLPQLSSDAQFVNLIPFHDINKMHQSYMVHFNYVIQPMGCWSIYYKNLCVWISVRICLSASCPMSIGFLLNLSITKFSIVIGSPRAYLSRHRRAITWVSDYRCPIWTFSNRIPWIGYPRDFHVNYALFNGFLSNVFYSVQNLG